MRGWLAAVVGAGALGFFVARLTASPAPSPAVVRTQSPLDGDALQADLRRAVREELRSARAELLAEIRSARETGAATPAPAEAPAAVPEVTTDEPASTSARALIARAASARRWGEDEAHELRRLIPRLTLQQRDEVLATLIPAINRGDIALDAVPPF